MPTLMIDFWPIVLGALVLTVGLLALHRFVGGRVDRTASREEDGGEEGQDKNQESGHDEPPGSRETGQGRHLPS